MPRAYRPKKAKEPKVPVTYEVSAVVAEVAHRLIRLYPMKFGWTTNFKLGFLMVHGSKPKPDPTFDFMAKFRKVPPLYHGLTGFDAVVEVQAWAWRDLDANQQEALVAHELCHGEMTEKGTLRVVKHDLEEFRFVVRQWGAWKSDIRAFEEQLKLFDESGAPARATEGVQEPIEAFRRSVEAGTTDVTITAGGKSATIKGKGAKANGQSAAPPH